MKKLGLNELFGGLITAIITAMCLTPSKPAVAPPYPPPPPTEKPTCPAGEYPFYDPETYQWYCLPIGAPEECYTPQCLYEKCIGLGYPEQSCRQMYLPETIILPPAPPPELPPVVVPAVTYVLTIQAGLGGSTVPVPGVYQPMAHDAIVSITAVPDSGYVFDHWTVNGEVRTENPIGWNESTENITLIAYFTPVAAPTAVVLAPAPAALPTFRAWFTGYSLYVDISPLNPLLHGVKVYYSCPSGTKRCCDWISMGEMGITSTGFIETINPDFYLIQCNQIPIDYSYQWVHGTFGWKLEVYRYSDGVVVGTAETSIYM